MGWDGGGARSDFIARAQTALLEKSGGGGPLDEARRRLAAHAPTLLAAPPTGPPPRTVAHKVRRGIGRGFAVLIIAAVGAIGSVWFAIDAGFLAPASAELARDKVADTWVPPEDPTIPADTSRSDYYEYQGLLQALEDAKNQATDPGEDSAEQPTTPSEPDTKPGGTTTTKPPESSNPAPPPSVPDDPILNSLSITVAGGYGTLQVEAYVTSTGGAVTVTNPAATISGDIGTVALSGPGTVDGSAWYTTSLDSVPAGEYSVTVSIGNLHQTNNITVY